MVILGIETSCDETSVAIVEGKKDFVEMKANIIASSLEIHAKTGGVIPENAARAQLKFMLPVLTQALNKTFGLSAENISSVPPPLDAIAVTYGPGLIGPLLIGVETARTLSYVWNKPVIPVNHMMGHIYANFISQDQKSIDLPEFPLIALVVSGGHTDLLYMKKHGHIQVLGGTRDDAAGEAFDKIGRLLGLPYPAGPVIEERAKSGDVKRFNFPRPLLGKKNYDFSFSGLKTAVLREVLKYNSQIKVNNLNPVKTDNIGKTLNDQVVNDISAGMQEAAVCVLVRKTLRAAVEFSVKSILLSGGVASNQSLRDSFQKEITKQKINAKLHFPPKILCTDNAAMIASAAYFNYSPVGWEDLTANPELYYE